MAVERITYTCNGRSYIGALVWNDKINAKRPLMLMSPNWLVERLKPIVPTFATLLEITARSV